MAGLLRHAPALSALTCPTVNSYKRLVPRLADGSVSWAPVWAAYGDNNRSCMLRLPDNRPAVENRSVDMAANMYLAAAFTLAAGLEGIEQGLDPGEPVADEHRRLGRAAEHGRSACPARCSRPSTRSRPTRWCTRSFPAEFVAAYVAMRRARVGGVPRRGVAVGGRPLPVQHLVRRTGMSLRVLYVSPMDGESTPPSTRSPTGCSARSHEDDIEMRSSYADFRDPGCSG